jgi:hypothetical protein
MPPKANAASTAATPAVNARPLITGLSSRGAPTACASRTCVGSSTVSRVGHSAASYLAREPNGRWIHSTNLTVPAHSLVRVTIYQYDTSTGLRNPFFARVQGTSGETMHLDGKTVDVVPPAAPAHTFAIPQLGVFVPLPGVADNAKNQCAAAPCTLNEAHHTILAAAPGELLPSPAAAATLLPSPAAVPVRRTA